MAAMSTFITYPDPRLSEAATPQPVDAALRAIGQRLLAAGTEAKAYGLAAAHIGEVAPIALVSISEPDKRDYRLLYNPTVVSSAQEQEIGTEGSVSLPGIEVDVLRARAVEITFDDENGIRHTLSLSGFAARVAQHEIDQVNGVFFLSRVSRLKRDAALKRFAKLGRRAG
ncbi:hypothetical protein ASE94_03415 [Devosia sp. Leaf64]|nr:hypothetical protein ASE94_03415 [Devosia sp. Leaf64]